MWIINSLVIHFNFHPKALAHSFTPEVLQVKECAPTPYHFVILTFELTIESIKKFGDTSLEKKF
jgi:hypothetical protein